jgi:hypothetical protein
MARPSPRAGSGHLQMSDPVAPLHAGAQTNSDPVVVMPDALTSLTGRSVRLQGVRILQGVAWTGVGLRLRRADRTSNLFEIFLSAGGGRQVVIGVLDEDDAVAAWRSAGAAMNLPLLLENAAGEISSPYPMLGGVSLGVFHFRRQHSFLSGRRPRFLTRRKPGRIAVTIAPDTSASDTTAEA